MSHARRSLVPLSLLSLCLFAGGCSSDGFRLFTYSHRDGGNVGASDGLGSALAGQSRHARVSTAAPTGTATAEVPPSDR